MVRFPSPSPSYVSFRFSRALRFEPVFLNSCFHTFSVHNLSSSIFVSFDWFLCLLVYAFLNPTLQGTKLAGYIVGITAAEAIIFCLIKGVETWRERWALRRGCVLEVDAIDEEEWQEVESPLSVKA